MRHEHVGSWIMVKTW